MTPKRLHRPKTRTHVERVRLPSLFASDPLARLWFLRAVAGAGIENFGRAIGAMDHEVVAAMGFSVVPEDMPVSSVKKHLRAAIERFSLARPRGVIHHNVARLARTVGLTPVEANVMTALIRLADSTFRAFQKYEIMETWDDVERLVASMLEIPRSVVSRTLRSQGTLKRAGLLLDRQRRFGGLVVGPASHLEDALLRGHRTDDEFLRAIVPLAPRSRLKLEDYPGLTEQIGLMRALLRASLRSPRGAASHKTRSAARAPNILLHGPPGTGKTELSRALVAAEGGRLYESSVTDRDGEAATRLERLGHVVTCRSLLAGSTDAVLVVDEAEDIFPSSGGGLFGLLRGSSPENKGYVARVLEMPRVPTIWITNDVDALGEAFLRRFDLIVAVDAPRGAARRRQVEKEARRVALGPETVNRLVADTRIPPAMVARAVQVAGLALAQDEVAGVSAARAVELVTSGFLRARGAEPRPVNTHEVVPWDVSLINASPSVESVLGGLIEQRISRASILLLGPPGTGKTEFVRQLAMRSGMPLVERKASELLSQWVGDTEKRIAAMFHEAKAMGAIVFLDEAETFLSARSEAMASWQVSQTNELLTRMVDFDGICIAATNLVDRFDSAAFRRFDLKVTFRPLIEAQRQRILEAAFGTTLPPDELRTLHGMSSHLEGLCTGDVVAVKRGMRLSGAVSRADELADLLAAEVARRERRRAKVIGFG